MPRRNWLLLLASIASVNSSLSAFSQLSFFQPLSYTGSGNTFVADFNRDGKVDILCSDGTMNLSNGDGTFRAGTPVSGGVAAVGDFNGDGNTDVLQVGSGTFDVLLGRGDGTFQEPINTSTPGSFWGVAAADFNGDGKTDVVGAFGGSLFVYISNGDGTFKPATLYNFGGSSLTGVLLVLGDFNGDGRMDIAGDVSVTNTTGQVLVLLGNGDGTFQTAKQSVGIYSFPDSAAYSAVGDFNGDGKTDLALSRSLVDCTDNCVSVLFGNGDGTFQPPTTPFPTPTSQELGLFNSAGPLAAVDLNGDGMLDFIYQSEPTVAQIYFANGDGTYSNTQSYSLAPGWLAPGNLGVIPFGGAIAIADFDGDGKPDLALQNVILRGIGKGKFDGIPLAITPSSSAFAIADFDNDGINDIATVLGSSLYVFHNDGTATLSLTHTYNLQQPVASNPVAADFNGDGKLDLAVIGQDPATKNWSYSILIGNGDGSFQSPLFFPQNAQANPYGLAVADFNNDQKPDLAVSADKLIILLGNGDSTFSPPAYYYVPGEVLIADFNGDSKLDIASGAAILFGNGDGTFQPPFYPASLNGFHAALTADFNNDGNPDLLDQEWMVAQGFNNQIAIGNGDATFTILSAPSNGIIGITDLNGDGKLDLFVNTVSVPSGHPSASGVQLGNGDGTFGPVITIPTAGLVSNGMFADMNGDGRTDIVFEDVAYFNRGIAVLLNTTPPSFKLSGTPGSQILQGGQSGNFVLAVAPWGAFKGIVSLSCAITPSINLGPICSLSNSSVQISEPATQNVTATVTTTAPVTDASYLLLSHKWLEGITLFCLAMLVGSVWLNRKPHKALVTSAALLSLSLALSCGASSSPTHVTNGTPAGTYTATFTATSGSASQSLTLKVIVQ